VHSAVIKTPLGFAELKGDESGLHRKKWLLEHESPVKQQTLF